MFAIKCIFSLVLQFKTLLSYHLHNRKARWGKKRDLFVLLFCNLQNRKNVLHNRYFLIYWRRPLFREGTKTLSSRLTRIDLGSTSSLALMSTPECDGEGRDIGLLFQQQRLVHNRRLLRTYWFSGEFRTMPTQLWAPWSDTVPTGF